MANPPVKVNYLSNKELLKEIHKSKNSYCFYASKEDADYDAIVASLDDITPELITQAQVHRATLTMQRDKLSQKMQGLKAHQIKVTVVNPADVDPKDLVFRVMDWDHIPLLENPKASAKDPANFREKVNFPPFKHYRITSESGAATEFLEVGRSHWKGDLETGSFNVGHGNITNQLAKMFMLMVERYGQKPNWRGYSYLDEMKSQSLLQLIQIGLKFDESRSQNPFSYYTTTMTNSFTGIFHKEKRNQNIRDDVLIMHGQTPSTTRQVEDAMGQRKV